MVGLTVWRMVRQDFGKGKEREAVSGGANSEYF